MYKIPFLSFCWLVITMQTLIAQNHSSNNNDDYYTTFEEQITKFKNWIALRLAWLDANIPGSSANCNLAVAAMKSKSNFSIYPNPAKDQLFISTTDHTLPDTIEFFDISGKSVMKINSINDKTVLNVGNLSNGIYICKLTAAHKAAQLLKVVVMH